MKTKKMLNGKVDKSTIYGLAIGLLAIVLGNWFEGGHFSSLVQGTAAFIVLGGTLGAVMVSTPLEDLKRGWQLLGWAFNDHDNSRQTEKVIEEIIGLSKFMRSNSIAELETHIPKIEYHHLKDAMSLVVDGVNPEALRDVIESDIDQDEDRLNQGAKIWLDAGSFAPTIGIIGAVLGLIHVMGNLSDTSKLGGGIAVAFVATIYGVVLANIVFLPIGNKLKNKIKKRMVIREIVLEGVVGIVEGRSPLVIEHKLRSYTDLGFSVADVD